MMARAERITYGARREGRTLARAAELIGEIASDLDAQTIDQFVAYVFGEMGLKPPPLWHPARNNLVAKVAAIPHAKSPRGKARAAQKRARKTTRLHR